MTSARNHGIEPTLPEMVICPSCNNAIPITDENTKKPSPHPLSPKAILLLLFGVLLVLICSLFAEMQWTLRYAGAVISIILLSLSAHSSLKYKNAVNYCKTKAWAMNCPCGCQFYIDIITHAVLSVDAETTPVDEIPTEPIITLTDEDGNPEEFEFLDYISMGKNKTYIVLLSTSNPEGEVTILQTCETSTDDISFTPVPAGELLFVFDIFKKKNCHRFEFID